MYTLASQVGARMMNSDHAGSILYLSYADVQAVGLGMAEMIGVLEAMFREKAEGRAEMPPKIGVHTMPDAFIHAMPAYLPGQNAVGMKWVSGYPNNSQRGLPYIAGVMMLNDPENGFPLAVMDCTWITAQRTGAATALAAKYLARGNSETVGILGCGVQGRSNLEALKVLFPLKSVRAYDTDLEKSATYALEMSASLGIEVIAAGSPREAVAKCDIVVTAGPILRRPHATIQSGWLSAGAFAALVDFDSYWHADALREVDKFCTDDVAQLEHYRQIGYFQHIPPTHAELGDLVTGKKAGRESAEERTVACNLGLALEDVAVASVIYARARERGIGKWLEL